MEKDWYLYIIKCRDNRLYTGISNDVTRRVATHNKGRGCRFTKYRHPVELQYQEKCGSKSAARQRELEIQGLTKSRKIELISEAKYERSFGG